MQEVQEDYFVFILESPSPSDMYQEISEGGYVCQAVNLNDRECEFRTASDVQHFAQGLKELMEIIKLRPFEIPILHISAHGDDDCIQLLDGNQLEWRELGQQLVQVNEAAQNRLILSMSCCHGICSTKMMLDDSDKNPFHTLITTHDSPEWAETGVAFSAFYHRLIRGADVQTAAAAMRAASGNEDFVAIHVEQARKAFDNMLVNATAQTIVNNIIE